ncbi:hypothetical protein E2C01_004484 [Portunus trituberculatus]|uniref:Uncharacterized protein n=1 Tax=Portunus trituberculatus TaxID=210409 RepID=A0A5B7CQN0_PORTR|nr:hypothetical protein [Portunus trituberculatus]
MGPYLLPSDSHGAPDMSRVSLRLSDTALALYGWLLRLGLPLPLRVAFRGIRGSIGKVRVWRPGTNDRKLRTVYLWGEL